MEYTDEQLIAIGKAALEEEWRIRITYQETNTMYHKVLASEDIEPLRRAIWLALGNGANGVAHFLRELDAIKEQHTG